MNILITGAWHQAQKYIPEIKDMGHAVCFLEYENSPLPCSAEWVEGIIGNGIFLNHNIETFANLEYIQLTSAGYDRVPMEYVNGNKIKIYNARGIYSGPMAEFALASVLHIYKSMNLFMLNQNNHVWEKRRDLSELAEKRVLIIGCGSVGTECAKRFKACEAEVVGVDLCPRKDFNYISIEAFSSLDKLLPSADVLIVTAPLTECTRGMMDGKRLKRIKNGAIIVNIARGPIIDEQALIEELSTNRFSAVLDVFEMEPLSSTSPLWDMPNVIITPHNSFVGEGNDDRLSKLIMKNLGEI